MIKFIFKAILRDKSRSVLPIIVISAGVFLTISLSGYIKGSLGDMIDQTARFQTGHVKIMSRAYANNIDQTPNDLALMGTEELTDSLKSAYPNYNWVNRIKFGGLLDAGDGKGGSKAQGTTMGMAVELFSESSMEIDRLNIPNSIVSGSIPSKSGEILIGADFAKKLDIKPGDEITFMGTTMNGAMTFENMKIAATVSFGVSAMDKGMIICDISDARHMLDMQDASGEILGYLKNQIYYDDKAKELVSSFNSTYAQSNDEYAPIMLALSQQNNMGSYLKLVDSFSSLFVIIFIIIMSVVLWNTGLIGGLRRYQEFGIRIALGEEKGHIYKTLIYEAILIGIIGSVIGTLMGIALTLFMQKHGIDISGMIENATMMMPTVMRSKFTTDLLYIGFIPGLFAMVIGNMLSGIGIYKRETAALFKELEV